MASQVTNLAEMTPPATPPLELSQWKQEKRDLEKKQKSQESSQTQVKQEEVPILPESQDIRDYDLQIVENVANNESEKSTKKETLVCTYCNKTMCRAYELRKHYGRCKVVQYLLTTDPVSLDDKVKHDALHFKIVLEKEKSERKRKLENGGNNKIDVKKCRDSSGIYIFSVCLRWCRTPEALKCHLFHSHNIDTNLHDLEAKSCFDQENSLGGSRDLKDPDHPENLTSSYSTDSASTSFSSSSSSFTTKRDVLGLGENEDDSDENDKAMQKLLADVQRYVQLDQETEGNWTVYTEEIRDVRDLVNKAKEVMSEQTHQFMIQIEIAYVLKDLKTLELTLFYAHTNSTLFQQAIKVKKRENVHKVVKAIKSYDWENFFSMPKSGLIPVRLAYARYIITTDVLPLTSCGCRLSYIPDWIKQNRYIYAANRTNCYYKNCDRICFFRSLAEMFVQNKNHVYGKTRSQIQKKLFGLFVRKYRTAPNLRPRDFDGIRSEELPLAEQLFSVKINVYIFELLAKATPLYPKQLKATPIYFSKIINPTNGECNLLRYVEHIAFISNIDKALGYLVCTICEQKRMPQNYARHFRICSNKFKTRNGHEPEEKYHDGEQYREKLDIFEQIERECSCTFPMELKEINYLAVFDSETWFDTFPTPRKRGKATITFSELKPYVLGACSNIPGYEPPKMWWITDHGDQFVDLFVQYLIEISEKQEELLTDQLAPVFDKLDSRLMKAEENENKGGIKLFKRLTTNLENFIRQLPVLTFNGAKFDCRILKRWLLPALFLRYGNKVKTQMKQGTYTRISTPDFIILDQLNYLPGGKNSYDNWIFESLGVRLKSKMPYSFLTSLDCLDFPGLPNSEFWYSSLKGYNLLSIDYESYQKYLQQGLNSDQALKNLGLQEVPKPAELLLEEYRKIFKEKKFVTFKDWIEYYLEFDLWPFRDCATEQNKTFFKHYQIHLYRSHASIPSVAVKVGMRYMHRDEIYIPCKENYKLLREKIVGGQSLIVTMEAIAGVTKIRAEEFGQTALTCQSIFSLDCNNMYGDSMRTLPVGPEIVRKANNNFIAEYASKKYKYYESAERAIAYFVWSRNLHNPVTYRNSGEWRCKTIQRRYQPDCVAEEWKDGKFFNHVIIEVYGHGGHRCPIHKFPEDDYHPIRKHPNGTKMTYKEVQQADQRRLQLLKFEFSVNEITVIHLCLFQQQYESTVGEHHENYLQFLKAYPRYNISKKPLTEQELLRQIYEGKLHGFLLATFESPPELKKTTELFPLFFHKAVISREHTGPIMEEYLRKMKLLRKPRMELISSHKAEHALIATNLVRFYQQLGVHITNIERLIQYELTSSMEAMVEKAADLRFKATNDEEKVLGKLAKTLVVSCYGKFLLNPKNFIRTKYVTSNGLLKELYTGSFIIVDYVTKLPDLDDYLYEIRRRPHVVHHNSPIHLGAWILNSSKLSILKVVRIFQQCMDPRTWTIFGSQTDSISVITSEKSFESWLENCVLPEKGNHLEKMRNKYIARNGDDEEARRSQFTPGMYKLEWTGQAAFGVSAKVYSIFNDDTTKKMIKLSARSVPQCEARKLTYSQFYDVLHKHKPITIECNGFNYVCGTMLCERMQKSLITPMYIKRVVQPDLTTKTLVLE